MPIFVLPFVIIGILGVSIMATRSCIGKSIPFFLLGIAMIVWAILAYIYGEHAEFECDYDIHVIKTRSREFKIIVATVEKSEKNQTGIEILLIKNLIGHEVVPDGARIRQTVMSNWYWGIWVPKQNKETEYSVIGPIDITN